MSGCQILYEFQFWSLVPPKYITYVLFFPPLFCVLYLVFYLTTHTYLRQYVPDRVTYV
jgi:hypothetical protein